MATGRSGSQFLPPRSPSSSPAACPHPRCIGSRSATARTRCPVLPCRLVCFQLRLVLFLDLLGHGLLRAGAGWIFWSCRRCLSVLGILRVLLYIRVKVFGSQSGLAAWLLHAVGRYFFFIPFVKTRHSLIFTAAEQCILKLTAVVLCLIQQSREQLIQPASGRIQHSADTVTNGSRAVRSGQSFLEALRDVFAQGLPSV